MSGQICRQMLFLLNIFPHLYKNQINLLLQKLVKLQKIYKITAGFVCESDCQLTETENLVLPLGAPSLNQDKKSLVINLKISLESSKAHVYHRIAQEV